MRHYEPEPDFAVYIPADVLVKQLVGRHGPVTYEIPAVTEPRANVFQIIGDVREAMRAQHWPEPAIDEAAGLFADSDSYDAVIALVRLVVA